MYESEDPVYCYPGTTVLKNVPGIRDAAELEEYETAITTVQADAPLPEGALDYAHYRLLHKHLFGEVYSWAGEPRTVRLHKGTSTFCYPENIDDQMAALFNKLAEETHLANLDLRQFAERAAYYLGEINAIHPFREGNGRTQLVFLILLAESVGHTITMDGLEREQVLKAMIDSFSGNYDPLRDLIYNLLQ